MKSKVLNRSMFRKAMDPENVGIMDGFKDAMGENLKKALIEGEMPEEDDDALEREDDDEEGESGKMIGRTPRSPEILMNTLRGDMRSIPSRREELAELVGEKAAMNTPEEVLTLLQSKLGQGIASVPGQPSAGPAPGGATPPPLPPSGAGAPLQPGASPMAGLAGLGEQLQAAGVSGAAPAAPQAPAPMPGPSAAAPGPLNMADGGEVSYERYYAEGGDVQKKSNPQDITSIFGRPDTADIKKRMGEYASLYGDVLGDSKQQKDMDKAIMLAQIAQRGFNFAANVSPTGTPLTGSFAARAAGAFGDVPGILVEGTKNQRERDQKIKLAALEAARGDESESRKLLSQLYIAGMKNKGSSKTLVKEFVDENGQYVQRNVVYDSDGNSKTTFTDISGNEIVPGKLYELGEKEDGAGGTGISGLSSKANEKTAFLAENAEGYLNGTLSPEKRRVFRSVIAGEFRPATDAEGNVSYIPSPLARDLIERDPSLAFVVPSSISPAEGPASGGVPGEDTAEVQPQREPTLYENSRGIGGLGALSAEASRIPLVSEIVGSPELLARRNSFSLQIRQLISDLNDNKAKSFSSAKDLYQALGNAQDPGILTTQSSIDAAVFAIDSAYARLIKEAQLVMENPTTSKNKREAAEEAYILATEARAQIGYQAGTEEEKAIRDRAELSRLRNQMGGGL
jgi:hypothetical protein